MLKLRPLRLLSAVLSACLIALVVLLPASQAVAQPPIEQLRAFWVDSANPGYRNHVQVDELVENVKRANANTIIVQMRRHGDAWYNQSLEPRAADPRLAPAHEFDPLAYLIERAHVDGIAVHAWLVVSVTCRNRDALRGHPQHICTSQGPSAGGAERWTTATFNGVQVGDLDFGHPSAVQHMEQVVKHMLAHYPALDGVHFDFIRYSGREYGYNQVSLTRFNQAYGLPLDHRPAPNDAAWSQWRRDRMTDLMRRLYIRIKAVNPRIQVSAATITWGGIGSYTPDDWPNSAAYNKVFQDWKAWLQEGILDFALPMHYFTESQQRTRDWYDGWLAWDRANTGRRAIAVGMGSWLNSPLEGIEQARRAVQPDAEGRTLAGVAFYSYNQPFAGSRFETRREFMDLLRSSIFTQPATAPVWPWIANPTTGHLQGIAAVDGEVLPGAKVSLVRDGSWVRDISAQGDGWYGAVDLEPGPYTIVVHHPDGVRQGFYDVVIKAGLVTNGP